MEFASTVEFAAVARRISRAAQRRGLVVPSFRCPPRVVGADRTIRRRPARTGSAEGVVVSVRVRDRPREAVVGDMIEGVVVANRLGSPEADRLRTDLWSVVAADEAAAHVA
ncbi:MAG: hypothetical protein AAF945_06865 [Actinomycetota bacterium]